MGSTRQLNGGGRSVGKRRRALWLVAVLGATLMYPTRSQGTSEGCVKFLTQRVVLGEREPGARYF